ncbi:MAG: hypothetical protein FJY34_03990 [Betaproteobacteria bacterium]|nr:hypothetical protein [Betaproteobacteria bacterium]
MNRLLVMLAVAVLAFGFDAAGNSAQAQIANINEAINKAGRQRMLSQRMAKFYQAINWGVAPANGAAEMDKARKEFVAGLQELEGAPSNTPAIKDELALGRQQWIFFENALFNRAGEKKAAALNVATTSERILEVMNNATGMYEQLQTRQ